MGEAQSQKIAKLIQHETQSSSTTIPTTTPSSTIAATTLKTATALRKAATNTRNCRTKQEQQTSTWSPQFNELIEIRKNLRNNTQTNNNNNNTKKTDNYNTYPLGDSRHSASPFQCVCVNCDAECIAGCRMATKVSKDDMNRSRSISMVNQRGNGLPTSINHMHCIDNNQIHHSCHSHHNNQQTVKTQRTHLLSHGINCRGRSKTVSTNTNSNQLISNNNNTIGNPSLLSNDTKNSRNSTTINEIDRLNGNVCTNLDTIGSARAVISQTRRIIGRNRSRTTISDPKCTHLQQCVTKTSASILNTVPSVKRGKRTLSSTQIEREKSDVKNIKVLKKKQVQNS